MVTKIEDLFSIWNIDRSCPIGLIFDIDELLFDNSKELFLAYKSLLDSRSIPIDSNETFPGRDLFEIINKIKDRYGIQDDCQSLINERREKYIQLLSQTSSSSKEGVKELFTFIEQNRDKLNIRLSCASSSEKKFVDIILKKVFSSCNLEKYVSLPDDFFYRNHNRESAVTCWELGLQKKPSPEIYLRALQKMGLPAQQCIAFEDSQSGLEAALAADLNVVIIPSASNVSAFENVPINVLNDKKFYKMTSLLDFLPILTSTILS